MRLKFDEQLALLNEELITMGALCENAIATSSKALTSGDFETGRRSQSSFRTDQPERKRYSESLPQTSASAAARRKRSESYLIGP